MPSKQGLVREIRNTETEGTAKNISEVTKKKMES